MLIKEPEWHHFFSKVPHFTALLKVAGWNRLGDLRNRCGVNKLVRILHNTDINSNIQLFQKYDNETLGALLVDIADEDIIRMMNTLNGDELIYWMDHVPIKKTIQIVNGLGSEQALYVIQKIGLEKSTELARGFTAASLVSLIQDFAISDLVAITSGLRITLIKQLYGKIKIPGLRILSRFMGLKNSVKLLNILGEKKTFKLLDLLSPAELVHLVRTLQELKLPKASAKALRELEELRKEPTAATGSKVQASQKKATKKPARKKQEKKDKESKTKKID